METTGNQEIHVSSLDLSDLDSVSGFTKKWVGGLDILVNNAGVMAIPERKLSGQGHEMQFATNHLGHFALAFGLHDALALHGGRIVSVSSVGHINGNVDFDDIDFEFHGYDAWVAYGQSKTANILFAVEAARRWSAEGIVANSLNPGRISGTKLGRYLKEAPINPSLLNSSSEGVSIKTVEQGAATSTLLAASPLVAGITGRYFEDCNEAEPNRPNVRRGVATYAIDPDRAIRLWDVSLKMIGR
jgi:NAD(P)-dependent dehydrogenase (short-subunit alcohol dehydrogenase family)